jgi:hypothetical protein
MEKKKKRKIKKRLTTPIILVLWFERISKVKIGKRFRIELEYVNSFNNKLQLNIGYGRLIELL